MPESSSAALLGAALESAPASAQMVRTVSCESATGRSALVASKFRRTEPATLLRHGAGGHAQDLVMPWTTFAATHDLVLIAPELPRDRSFEDEARVFRCVVEDARKVVLLDPRRAASTPKPGNSSRRTHCPSGRVRS